MNYEAKTNTSPLDQWSLGMTTIETNSLKFVKRLGIMFNDSPTLP